MPVPISNVTRRVVYSASGTGPYAFTFEILANTDIAVYKDDTLLTLTTDYTVTINANGTGSITLTASPTGATQIAIVGNRTIQRTTDFVTGGDFFANTVNDELDQQTIFAQQNAEGLQRALQAPQTDPTSINMILPRASVRASKVLSFDASGNPSATEFIGSNRGNWAASTTYYVRDIVKDTSTSNIWQCLVQHTSSGSQPISTNTDSAKWFLLVDAASAGASASAAAASASAAATSASNASTSATNAASSASTASTQASNASTSATNAANSATAAASSASTASTAATNAGNSATAAASSATSASNSASSASTSASNAASSASSASTSASNASTSATNAANSATSAASSATTATNQATTATTQATNAANSATAAAASAAAAAASFDAFDDIYLGAKSSDPSVDNDGNALTTGDQYFNTVANELRVYNGSTWQAASTVGGTVTSLTVTGATTLNQNPTLSAGTANGVLYLNGSKVATSGSALTFDGAYLLTLNNGSSGQFNIGPSGTGQGRLYSDSTGFFVGSVDSIPFIFRYANSEQMRLTSTGLGIGTSSPQKKLVVSNGGAVGMEWSPTDYTGNMRQLVYNRSTSAYVALRTEASQHEWYIGGSESMRLDSSGNLGLGVTPSAWGLGSGKAVELSAGSLFTYTTQEIDLAFNSYFNGSNWIYKNTAAASYYRQISGQHQWYNASSGTAGNTISFTQAMTLDANSVLNVYNAIESTGPVQTNSANKIAMSLEAVSTGRIAVFGADTSTFGTLVFSRAKSNGGTTESARIDSSGNLGIGTTSPVFSDGSGVHLQRAGVATYRTYNSSSTAAGEFRADATGTAIDCRGLEVFRVLTGGAERARITSGGYFKASNTGAYRSATTTHHEFYQTNNDPGLTVTCTNTSQTTNCLRVFAARNTTGNSYYAIEYYNDGADTSRFRVADSGNVTNTNNSYGAISDIKLKENITDATPKLAGLMQVRVRNYNLKSDPTHKQLGVIAQELEQVFPGMVEESPDRDADGNDLGTTTKQVKYSVFVPMLIKAMQEQQAIIEQLKADVAALKGA